MSAVIDQELLKAAHQARDHAYVPYSGYAVGSALRTVNGQVFTGCNFENLSYGATICAERNAIGAMVVTGERKVAEIVVVTADGGTPCGMCLCVLAEFCSASTKVHCVEPTGVVRTFDFQELYPHGFVSDHVALAPTKS